MSQDNVAAPLPVARVTHALKELGEPPSKTSWGACSHGHFHQFFVDRRRSRLAAFVQALQVRRDSLFRVGDSLLACLALGHTAGQRRDLSHEDAVFVLVDQNAELQLSASTPRSGE